MAGRGTDILLGGNPAGLASDLLRQRGLNPAEVDKDTYDAASQQAKSITVVDHDAVVEAGRPAHPRHRAPREPPDRQPASRPRRSPGRPGLVAVLSLARRRSDEALRLGPGRRPDGAPGARRGRRHRAQLVSQDDRERPDQGRGLQLRHPQARRRVRRRHQPPARDDLRRARQGPPQRGSHRDRARLPRGRDRGPGRYPHGIAGARRVGPRRAGQGAHRDGPQRARHHDRTTSPMRRTHAIRCASTSRVSRSARSTPRRSSTATRRGASPSGSCCSGRSTRCGWST